MTMVYVLNAIYYLFIIQLFPCSWIYIKFLCQKVKFYSYYDYYYLLINNF